MSPPRPHAGLGAFTGRAETGATRVWGRRATVTAFLLRLLTSARRSSADRMGLGAAVLLLAAAIIAMHAAGTGHHQPVLSLAAGLPIGANHQHDPGVAQAPATADASPTTVSAAAAQCEAGCVSGSPVEQMTSMVCLAVIPPVVLLLLRSRYRIRQRTPWASPSGRSRSRGNLTGLPPHLSPPLRGLCIIRS